MSAEGQMKVDACELYIKSVPSDCTLCLSDTVVVLLERTDSVFSAVCFVKKTDVEEGCKIFAAKM